MNTCRTCQHWRPVLAREGKCVCVEKKGLVVQFGEWLLFRDDFGCVGWRGRGLFKEPTWEKMLNSKAMKKSVERMKKRKAD